MGSRPGGTQSPARGAWSWNQRKLRKLSVHAPTRLHLALVEEPALRCKFTEVERGQRRDRLPQRLHRYTLLDAGERQMRREFPVLAHDTERRRRFVYIGR